MITEKTLFCKFKNTIIVFAVVAISIVIVSIIGIFLWWETELLPVANKVKFIDQMSGSSALIDENGDCYVRGGVPPKQKGELGFDHLLPYKILFNMGKEDRFVRIYDDHNARAVQLSADGGTIITQDDELYLFTSLDKAYYTPHLFAENIRAAELCENRLYCIDRNDCFGYYQISTPEKFEILQADTAGFCIIENEITVVTQQNELILFSLNGAEITKTNIRDNIQKVIVHRYDDGYSCVAITTSGEALYCNGKKGSLRICLTEEIKRFAEDVVDAAVFNQGIMVLGKDGKVTVTGDDLGSFERVQNMVICENAKMISAYNTNAFLLTQNGEIECFGTLPSSANISFKSMEIK